MVGRSGGPIRAWGSGGGAAPEEALAEGRAGSLGTAVCPLHTAATPPSSGTPGFSPPPLGPGGWHPARAGSQGLTPPGKPPKNTVF